MLARPPFCLFALVVTLTASLSACDSGPISPPSTRFIEPLDEGNRWEYYGGLYSDGEWVAPSTSRAAVIDKVQVHYEGEKYSVALWSALHPQTGKPVEEKRFYWNGPGGLYSLGGRSRRDTLITKTLLLKYPAEEGDTFQSPNPVYDRYTGEFAIEDTLAYTVVDTDAQFETPAGTFRCYVYHHRSRPQPDVAAIWDYYDYYAPGIGRVGRVAKSGEKTKTKYVLTEYRVNFW